MIRQGGAMENLSDDEIIAGYEEAVARIERGEAGGEEDATKFANEMERRNLDY